MFPLVLTVLNRDYVPHEIPETRHVRIFMVSCPSCLKVQSTKAVAEVILVAGVQELGELDFQT